jgi:iron-sulfur cluster assembly protein
MFKVTIAAAEQIRRAAIQGGSENMALRVAAKRGPDGSIEYGMGFDIERASDIELVSEGVTLLISKHSRDLLNGTVLDFVELNPGDFQFIFIGPDAAGVPQEDEPSPESAGGNKGSCGCS